MPKNKSNSFNCQRGKIQVFNKQVQTERPENKENNNHLVNENYVKLNVGGKLFVTTKQTLTRHESMLKTLVTQSNLPVKTDEAGWILIDRSGEYFETILNFLRESIPGFTHFRTRRSNSHHSDSDIDAASFTSRPRSLTIAGQDSGLSYLKDMSLVSLKSLLIEARFYLLEPLVNILVDIIDSKTPKFTETRNFTYTIPVLMNREDEFALASQSYCKPCIRFCYNRANNRYSYTPNSDDMILKNIELFDKLTFRYYSAFCRGYQLLKH